MDARARERTIDLSAGWISLALFLGSIAVLFWFLVSALDVPESPGGFFRRELRRATAGAGDGRALFDTLLVLAWGFLHSFMARPRFKVKLQKVLRPHLHPALYAGVASASLIAVCLLYRPIARPVWALEGGSAMMTRVLFYGGWALFCWCWFHMDLLEVVGLRPIQRYLSGQARPPEPFRPTGPFLMVRHPVELSFLIVFWATPSMTAGHLLFAGLMTLYTCVGIDLEDRRMLELHGDGYREYVKRVPQIVPLPR